MATVREVKARFIADANAMKRAMQDIKSGMEGLNKTNKGTSQAMKTVGGESDKMAKSFRTADGRIMTLNRSASSTGRTFTGTIKNARDMTRQLNLAGSSAGNVTKTFKGVNGNTLTLNRTVTASAKTFRTAGQDVTALGRHFSAAETDARVLGSRIKTTGGTMDQLGSKVDASSDAMKGNKDQAAKLGTEYDRTKGKTEGLGRGAEDAEQKVRRSSGRMKQSVDGNISTPFVKAVGSVRNFVSSVGTIAASLGVFSAVNKGFNLIRDSIGGATARLDTFERFDRVMTTLTGSASETKRALDLTNEAVTGTAYTLNGAASAVQNFYQRTKSVDKSVGYVKAWGDAVAFYGDGSSESFDNVTDALNKMLTNGKVGMDQLDRILEQNIDAIGIYSQATGKNAEDVSEALSKGKIRSQEFIDVVSKAMMEGTNGVKKIAGAAREAGSSWGSVVGNMRTAIVRGVANIITATDTLLKKNKLPDMRGMIANFGTAFGNTLNRAADQIPKLAAPMQKYLFPIIRGLGTFVKDYLVPAFRGFYEAVKPIAAVVAGGLLYGFQALVGAMNNLLGPFIKYLSQMKLLGPLLAGVVSALVAYKAITVGIATAQAAQNAITKAAIALSKAQRAAHLAMVISGGGVRGMLLAWTAAMRALNLTMLANPFVLVGALIVGLGAAVVAAYKKFDGFRSVVDNTWSGVKKAFQAGVDFVKDILGVFIDHWKAMFEVWKAIFAGDFPKAFDLFKDTVKNTLGNIGDVLDKHLGWLKDKFVDATKKWSAAFDGWIEDMRKKSPAVDAMFRGFEQALGYAKAGFNGFMDVAKQMIPVYEEFFRGFANALQKLFSGDFSGAFGAFKKTYSEAFASMKDIALERLDGVRDAVLAWFDVMKNRIRNKVDEWKAAFRDKWIEIRDETAEKLAQIGTVVMDWITSLPGRIKTKLTEWKDAFSDKFAEIRDEVSDKLDTIGTAVENFLTSMPGRIKTKLIGWGQAFNDWIMEQKAENKRQFSEWGENILSYFGDIGVRIKGLLDKDWAGKIGGWFKDIPGKIGEWLGGWWSKITGWISDKKTEWTNKLSGWTEAIAKWFHGLPGRVGEWLGGFMGSIVKWIQDKKSEWTTNLATWTERIVTWFRELPGRTAKALADWFSNIRTNVVNAKDRFVKSFDTWWTGLKSWFSNLGKKKEIADTGKNIVKNLAGGSEKEKPQLMDRIGKIIVDGIKYALLIGGVIALAVGRELIKRMISGVQNMKAAFDKAFANLVDILKKKLKDMGTAVSKKWSEIWTGTTKFLGNVKNSFSTGWNLVKKVTSTALSGVVTAVKNKFNDIVQRAKDLPKRLGDGIGAMAGKVTAGVTKVINKLASTLGKGVNGVIGGINWALDKIGVSKKNQLKKWPVPQYAQGTDDGGHPGGPAIVGDGKGDNRGQELVRTPDGEMFLSPKTDTLVDLPRGTTVVSAKNTKKILKAAPRYAGGTKDGNFLTHMWTAGKAAGKAAVSKVLDVFDYVKKPGKLLDLALSTLGITKPGGAGTFVGNMARGAWDYVKGKAGGYIKGMLQNFGGGEQKGPGFRAPFRLSSRAGMRFHPIYHRWQMHWGDDYGAPYNTPIPSQAAGVVSYVGYHKNRGNYVKVRSGSIERLYQHNSRNAVHVGQNVRQGQTIGYVGSTGASTGPHLHYEVYKNGAHVMPAKYADGGIVNSQQLAWIADGGFAESIISHDPAKRVSQRAIWEQTGRELGFLSAQNSDEVIGLLGRIAEATERGLDLSVILDDEKVGRILSPIVSRYQQRRDSRIRRFDAGGNSV